MFKTLDKESAICKFDLGSFTAWLVNNGKNGHGHSEKSTKAHLSDLRGFITWFEAHTGQIFAPELITSSDLRAYFTWSTQEERVAASTWNRRRISLALFCQFALSAGLVAYNPFQGVPVMESTQLAPLSLNKSDYAKFMRRVEQAANTSRTDNQRRLAIRNRAMIACMVYAGLRESEVCELRPSTYYCPIVKAASKSLMEKGINPERSPWDVRPGWRWLNGRS
jgi:site-specific recombinase XerD